MYASSKESNLNDLKNGVREAGREVKEDLVATAHKAGSNVRALFNTAGSEISHATDAVTSQIRSKPMQSSAIALLAGVALGLLFRR